ncbi:hypothetical protein HPULCUR_009269 [Helicostylum pulchrum]|uniref:Uncharacterized protein n=1 Tax=Helicostylum pulchrum TaxID=562976 RepID=A0ABP9Y9Z0_9FUNG
MGCCQSNEVHDGKARTQEIDDQIKRDKMNQKNEVKMLLLGAGESGKSTILKQMKLIHDGGYSRDEREAFKEIIFSNTVQSMRVIIEAMENMGVSYAFAQNKHHSAIILDLPSQIERESLPADVTLALKSLWKDTHLQSVFDRSREYQLNDSAK